MITPRQDYLLDQLHHVLRRIATDSDLSRRAYLHAESRRLTKELETETERVYWLPKEAAK